MTDEVATRQKTRVGTPAELTAAREARGMSQIDISHRLKLQVRQVNALEEGQWEALPGRSFVRGALRSYGRLLDVDVAPLLEAIGGFAEPAPVHGLQPLDTSLSRSSGLGFNGGGQGRPILWVVASLAGVIALVLYFGSAEDSERIRSWLPSPEAPGGTAVSTAPAAPIAAADPLGAPASSDPPTPAPPAASAAAAGTSAFSPAASSGGASPAPPATAALPASAGMAPGAGAQAAPPGFGGVGALGGSGVGPEAAAAAGGAAGGSSAPAGSSVAADVRGSLRLQAVEDSWVEVRQADGSKLHNALVRAGSSIDLKGSPPYRLVIGNATGLRLSYEGKARDLAPHIGAHNIAKLQLQ